MASTFRRPPVLPRTNTETGAPPKLSKGVPTQEYADKRDLARRLDEQGVNPLAWTRAQPAAFADQDEFRKTGRKPRDNQFEVGGRLYDWSPEIAATPAQGRAALNAYLKEIGDPGTRETAPLESYVDIDKVPLRHPFGQPASASSAEDRDIYLRNMIKVGVNPATAHLGDPVPMPMQDKLKGAFEQKLLSETTPSLPVATTQPEATDLLYRNADGWIYAKNEATRESPSVTGIRARYGEKRAALPAPAANDNDTDEEGEILQHYRAADVEKAYNEQAAKEVSLIATDMPQIVSLVEKAQAGQALDAREQQILISLQQKFSEVGLELDPAKADIAYLRTVATAVDKAKASVDKAMTAGISAETQLGRAPLHVAAQALNNEIAQALAGSTIAWAQVSQKGPGEAFMRGLQGMRRNLRPLGLITQATIGAANAAEIAREWAEEDGNPDIMSPYPKEEAETFLPTSASNEKNAKENSTPPISSPIPAQQTRELAPPSPDTLNVLATKAADVDQFEIIIGGVPVFKQGEHKTLMDTIFREEFIKVAQEKGCLPDPRDPKKSGEFGGGKSQKRIGDPDKPGNLGSRQPDSTVRWQNADQTWTEVHWNSTTSGPDGFAETLREWRALVGMNENINKQVAQVLDGVSKIKKYRTPVLGDGPIYHMAEKRRLTNSQLREYIRNKLRDRFDKDFKDCKFIGESRIVKLDSPDDPDMAR